MLVYFVRPDQILTRTKYFVISPLALFADISIRARGLWQLLIVALLDVLVVDTKTKRMAAHNYAIQTLPAWFSHQVEEWSWDR